MPACGYFLVETFTWTIPDGAPITENTSGGSSYVIDVESTDPSHDDTYSVTLGLSALYATLQTTYTQSISLSITVTDPCLTTTYEDFTLTQMTMEAGQTITQDFNQPLISAGTDVNDQAICGDFTYNVFEVVNGINLGQTLVTVAQVAGIQQRLTATTQDEADQGIHTMRLIVSLGLVDYPTYEVDFNLLIQPATCDCNLLVWDEPAQLSLSTLLMADPVATITLQMATVNADSTQAEPAIRSCTGAYVCDTSSTVALVDKDTASLDAAFMTFDDGTLVLSVEPTVSSQINTYTMELTQTVQTGHAPIVMDAVIVVVDCVITEIRTPDTPATIVYNLMAATHFEDLAPAFYQWPPCDYVLTETIAWALPTIDADTDAIQAVSDYRVSVYSAELSIHGVYTLTVTDTVTYESQSWAPSVSFDVDFRDPCKTSTITAISLSDMSVVLGESTYQNFAEVEDSAEDTYGLDSCGQREYSIVLRSDSTTVVDFARIETIVENQNYRIISDYSDEAYEGTHELQLYVVFVNYPVDDDGSHPTLLSDFDLTITPATCDCKLLDWVYPAAQSASTTVLRATDEELIINHATVDEASKTPTPAIRACYRAGGPGCDETTVMQSVVIESTGILPGYMTMS